LIIILAVPTSSAAQDIFKWKDDKGQWKFSNSPPLDESHAETAKPVTQPGRNCAPFKIGETRRLPGFTPWPTSFPKLEVLRFDLKLMEIGPGPRGAARFQWWLHIRNRDQLTLWGAIKFSDCSGFVLGEANITQTQLQPERAVEMFGLAGLEGALSHTVGNFTLTIKIPGMSLNELR
jgi:hypothetical protein